MQTKKFKYHTIMKYGDHITNDELNKYGADGWELVSRHTSWNYDVCTFKMEII